MIILASRSPQRRSLLTALGVPFRTVASEFTETALGADPEAVAIANAIGKAREVAGRVDLPPEGAVLGADTVVSVDGRILGKPRDRREAGEMLDALAGREHSVLSGVCLVTPRGELSDCDRTDVRFRRLPQVAREWYLGTGEWRERAGGYAIQGAGMALVERIEGDHSTVVGLPVGRLVGMLTVLGLGPWAAGASAN